MPELQLLDFGTDYYAMQSFEAGGRQIAFAWLFNWEYRKPEGSAYSGEMSLPRVLSLSEDRKRLRMLPTIEVDDHFAADPIVEDQSGKFSLPTARSITWRSLATEMTFVCFMTVESSRSSPMAELFVEPVAATRTSTPITWKSHRPLQRGCWKGM
jgi:sucrose-6-phosphate hydrolase SacC (GH32 family)